MLSGPRFLAQSVALLCVIGLTAWNLTRSSALTEAEAAYRRSNLTEALRKALDHLDRRPWSGEGSRLAALSLSRLDFPEQAEPYYRRAGSLSLPDLHVRGYGLLRGNRREEAAAAYEKILARWPEDAEALRLLAGLRMTQSRWPDALALTERLARIPSAAVLGETMSSSILHQTHGSERAVAAFDRVLALDPDLRVMPLDHVLFLRQFGEDLLATGQPAKARQILLRAESERPQARRDDVLLWDLIGQADQQLGRFKEARDYWQRGIDAEPKAYSCWLNLGRLDLQEGRAEDALKNLDRAEALYPESYEVVYSKIRANQRLGRRDEVVRLQAKADRIRAVSGQPTSGMGAMSTQKP